MSLNEMDYYLAVANTLICVLSVNSYPRTCVYVSLSLKDAFIKYNTIIPASGDCHILGQLLTPVCSYIAFHLIACG